MNSGMGIFTPIYLEINVYDIHNYDLVWVLGLITFGIHYRDKYPFEDQIAGLLKAMYKTLRHQDVTDGITKISEQRKPTVWKLELYFN